MSAAWIAARLDAARERRTARAEADPHAGRCPHCGGEIDVLEALGPERAMLLDGRGGVAIVERPTLCSACVRGEPCVLHDPLFRELREDPR